CMKDGMGYREKNRRERSTSRALLGARARRSLSARGHPLQREAGTDVADGPSALALAPVGLECAAVLHVMRLTPGAVVRLREYQLACLWLESSLENRVQQRNAGNGSWFAHGAADRLAVIHDKHVKADRLSTLLESACPAPGDVFSPLGNTPALRR